MIVFILKIIFIVVVLYLEIDIIYIVISSSKWFSNLKSLIIYNVISSSNGKTRKKKRKYYISYLVGDINNGIEVKSKIISLDKKIKEMEQIEEIEKSLKWEFGVREVYILFFTKIK